MTHSRPFRVLFLLSILMAVLLVWPSVIGWRAWARWRAVREMRAAVEAHEPERFLDAVEAAESLRLSRAAADDIAPLRYHPSPQVRIYAVIALTVLRPRRSTEAQKLIDQFNDPKEDLDVQCAAARCLVTFGEESRDVLASLFSVLNHPEDPRVDAASFVLAELLETEDIANGPLPNNRYRIRKVQELRFLSLREQAAGLLGSVKTLERYRARLRPLGSE